MRLNSVIKTKFALSNVEIKMDRYRVEFTCLKEPNGQAGLNGYLQDKKYVGRAFNGFYEISPNWGNGETTKLIDKKTFFQYFDVIHQN